MDLTPRQIVAELNRYIVGQEEAKKAVAVALRNRYRRSRLSPALREEITPKNIIMQGPTGVGKTEIARRLAKLVKAPFVKVEATKYTEVGYVGRDVESMVRDLVEMSVRLVKDEQLSSVKEKATKAAEEQMVKILLPDEKKNNADTPESMLREEILFNLRQGKYDNRTVEITVDDIPRPVEMVPGSGQEIDIGGMFGGLFPKKRKKRKMTVKEAFQAVLLEESNKLVDLDAVNEEAVKRAEQEGIIFIDEIDKIAARSGRGGGPDVSREGVQRDILPIVEGCTVNTKYGMVRTDFILFIAAGAFHLSKVSDLIPELQGRFPISVTLESLSKEDFVKILSQPENAITKQYTELLAVDNIQLTFTPDALEEIAEVAVEQNNTAENIGARRLHTIMEQLLADVSYNAGGDHPIVPITVDKVYVEEQLRGVMKNRNMKRFIL